MQLIRSHINIKPCASKNTSCICPLETARPVFVGIITSHLQLIATPATLNHWRATNINPSNKIVSIVYDQRNEAEVTEIINYITTLFVY